MTSPHDSTLNMMVRMNDQIFARIHEGKLSYPKDVETLLSYVDMSVKLNEPIVAGWVMLTVGVANSYMGKLEQSIADYDAAYKLFAERRDYVHMAAAINNMGETHRVRGTYQTALDLYRDALKLSEKAPEDYVHPVSTLTRNALVQILVSNIGLCYLALSNFNEAETTFEQALSLFEGQTRANLDSMCEIRRGLAEVYLAQNNLPDAYSSIELARTTAESIQNNVILGDIFLTMAHILEADPNATESAIDYYRHSRELLQSGNLPITFARTVLSEARYQRNIGNTAEAHRLAAEAHELFLQIGMDEEARLATAMLV